MALVFFEEAEAAVPEAASGGGECGCSFDRKIPYKLAFWRFLSSKLDSSYKNDPKIISKRPLN
jgi:hypothetical protein